MSPCHQQHSSPRKPREIQASQGRLGEAKEAFGQQANKERRRIAYGAGWGKLNLIGVAWEWLAFAVLGWVWLGLAGLAWCYLVLVAVVKSWL